MDELMDGWFTTGEPQGEPQRRCQWRKRARYQHRYTYCDDYALPGSNFCAEHTGKRHKQQPKPNRDQSPTNPSNNRTGKT